MKNLFIAVCAFFAAGFTGWAQMPTAGMSIWLNAESVVTSSNVITQMTDLSGNGRNAVLTLGDPLLVSGVANGYPVVRFNGNDRLNTPSFSAFPGDQGMFFIVARVDGSGTYGTLLTNYNLPGNNFQWGGTNSGGVANYSFYTGTGCCGQAIGSGPTGYEIIAVERNGGTYTFYRRGEQVFTLGAPVTIDPNPLLIGANDVGIEALIGDIAEVVGYSTVPDATDRDAVFAYLGCKYGIATPQSSNRVYSSTSVSDGILVQDSPQLPFDGIQDFTVSCFLNLSQYSSSGALFLNQNNMAEAGVEFWYWHSSNILRFNANGSTIMVQATGITLALNQWYHIVCTRQGGVARIYLNGTLIATNSSAPPALNVNAALRIGNYPFGGYHTFGKMDDVSIWNSALSAAQINSVLTQPLSGSEPGLVAYYPMEQSGSGAGVVVQNACIATGSALNGVTIGTATSPSFIPDTSMPSADDECPSVIPALENAVRLDNNTIASSVTAPMPVTGTASFSASAWFYRTDPSGQQYIMGNRVPGNGGWVVYIDPGGGLTLFVNGTYFSSALTPALNTWTHFAVRRTGNQIHFFVNGSLAASGTTSASVGTGYLVLGDYDPYSFTSSEFEGSIDEVTLWNVALTNDQIYALAACNAEIDTSDPALRLYFDMDIVGAGGGIVVPNRALSTGSSQDGLTVGSNGFPLFASNVPACQFEPLVSPSGPQTICNSSSVVLSASPIGAGYSYQWMLDGAPISGANAATYSASGAGVYACVVTFTGGLGETSNSVQVTAISVPTPTITVSDPGPYCDGDIVTLTSSSAVNNLWSNGSVLSAIAVGQSGNYTVTVTGSAGCQATSAAVPIVFSGPLQDFTASSVELFLPGNPPVDFVAQTTGTITSYAWDFGDGSAIASAAAPSHSYNLPGFYDVTLTVQDNNGCSGSLTKSEYIQVWQVFETADTGLPVTNDVSSVSFANPVSGCVTIRNNALSGVCLTNNGGSSWTPLPAVVGSSQPTRIRLTGNAGWLTGTNGLLCVSVDGGGTWSPVDLGVPNDINTISFSDDNTGYLGGSGGLLCVYNNGIWSPVTGLPSGSGWDDLSQYTFADLANGNSAGGWFGGVANGGGGGRYYGCVIQGGNPFWYYYPFGPGVQIWGISFLGGYTSGYGTGGTFGGGSGGGYIGCVVGSNSSVYGTSNGGQSWDLLTSGLTPYTLRDIVIIDENHAICVGDHGTVLSTDDGGQSWDVWNIGDGQDLTEVTFRDCEAYICGVSGRVFRFPVNFIPELPQITAPNGNSGCDGDQIVIEVANARPGNTYVWSNGDTDPQTLVSTGGSYFVTEYSACDTIQSNVVNISITPVQTWYADADDDGYGDEGTSVSDCIQPVGFVAQAGDCDDSDETVHPGAEELCLNGIDDDCDGQTDEFCIPTNNDPQNAIPVSTSALNACNPVNGNLTLALPSSEGNSPCITCEDLWYSFVATEPGVRIEALSSQSNLLIELQNSVGVTLDAENGLSGTGNEILNYAGLVIGQTYFIRIANFNSAQGTGSFTLCVQRIPDTFCNYGFGPYSTCQSFKAVNVGAAGYGFEFTDQLTGEIRTASTTAGISTVQLAMLIPGRTYDVSISTLWNLSNSLGQTEVIEVESTNSCSLGMSEHVDPDLRVSDACPNTRQRNTIIGATTWICGASYYEWEFTPVSPSPGLAFSVYGPGTSRFIDLGLIPGIVSGATYSVRIRPWFESGTLPGNWGPDSQCLSILGPALLGLNDIDAELERMDENGEDVEGSEWFVFPNPGNGRNLFVNYFTTEDVTLTITDIHGRIVEGPVFLTAKSELIEIRLINQLASGIYLLRFDVNGNSEIRRWVVE